MATYLKQELDLITQIGPMPRAPEIVVSTSQQY